MYSDIQSIKNVINEQVKVFNALTDRCGDLTRELAAANKRITNLETKLNELSINLEVETRVRKALASTQ